MPTLPSRLETEKFPVAPQESVERILFLKQLQDTDGELAFGWDENPEKQQANAGCVCFSFVESPNPQEKKSLLIPADLIHADILFR